MKIGFIGCGNMATAIIRGAVHSNNFLPEQIIAFDLDETKSETLKNSLGICKADALSVLLNNSDVIVLAVKPNVFPSLIPEIADSVRDRKPLVISIAAGKTIDFICSLFGFKPAIVRVMPNINAEVFEAVSAYCANGEVSPEQKQTAVRLLDSCGKSVELEEEYFSIFSVVGGCAPAYTFMFIDALYKGAVEYGLPEELALNVAAQTVLGSAKMIQNSTDEPWELIRRVCSPGGTTIEGINSLKEDDLTSVVIKAMKASFDKDKRM